MLLRSRPVVPNRESMHPQESNDDFLEVLVAFQEGRFFTVVAIKNSYHLSSSRRVLETDT